MKIGKITIGTLQPSCIIIGAQKAGTSSLYYYLSQHPQVLKPTTKELHFFDREEPMNIFEYHKKFPKGIFYNKISLEATPRYLYYPGLAERLYRYNKDLKLIILLRDPVKRAFSAWNMYQQLTADTKVVSESKRLFDRNDKERGYEAYYRGKFNSFEDITSYELSDEFDDSWIEPSLIRRGYYKEQIECYLEYFRKEHILFVNFDSFNNNLEETLARVTDFMKISQFDYKKLNLEPRNKRRYDRSLSGEYYSELIKHFQSKNTGLEELTGLSLHWMH